MNTRFIDAYCRRKAGESVTRKEPFEEAQKTWRENYKSLDPSTMSEKVQVFCAAVSEWEKEKINHQNFQGKGWFNPNIDCAQRSK